MVSYPLELASMSDILYYLLQRLLSATITVFVYSFLIGQDWKWSTIRRAVWCKRQDTQGRREGNASDKYQQGHQSRSRGKLKDVSNWNVVQEMVMGYFLFTFRYVRRALLICPRFHFIAEVFLNWNFLNTVRCMQEAMKRREDRPSSSSRSAELDDTQFNSTFVSTEPHIRGCGLGHCFGTWTPTRAPVRGRFKKWWVIVAEGALSTMLSFIDREPLYRAKEPT